MVCDRQSAILAECFWGDFYAGGAESSLVFVAVDHADDFADGLLGQAPADDFFGR